MHQFFWTKVKQLNVYVLNIHVNISLSMVFPFEPSTPYKNILLSLSVQTSFNAGILVSGFENQRKSKEKLKRDTTLRDNLTELLKNVNTF